MKRQEVCDAKMQEFFAHFKDTMEREDKMRIPMAESVRLAIKRLDEYAKMDWDQGDYFKFEEHDYNWFLEQITSNKDSKYVGCQVFIPETVIFLDGKVEKIIKTDANGHVTTTRGTMGLPELKKQLEASYRERKRD